MYPAKLLGTLPYGACLWVVATATKKMENIF